MAVGGWRLAVGGWRLAVGGWRLAVGGWRLAVGGWRLAVVYAAAGAVEYQTPRTAPTRCCLRGRGSGWL